MKYIKYVPLGLLCLFGLKCLAISSSLNEVLVAAMFAGSYLFMEYKEPNQKIQKLENDFKKLQSDVEEHTKVVEVVKNNMSSIKIAQAYSKTNSGLGR